MKKLILKALGTRFVYAIMIIGNVAFAPQEEPVTKKARVEMKQIYGVPTYDTLFKYVFSDEEILSSFLRVFAPDLNGVGVQSGKFQRFQLLDAFIRAESTQAIVSRLKAIKKIDVIVDGQPSEEGVEFLMTILNQFDLLQEAFREGQGLFQNEDNPLQRLIEQEKDDWTALLQRADFMSKQEVQNEISTDIVRKAFEKMLLSKMSLEEQQAQESYRQEINAFRNYSQHTAGLVAKRIKEGIAEGKVEGRRKVIKLLLQMFSAEEVAKMLHIEADEVKALTM